MTGGPSKGLLRTGAEAVLWESVLGTCVTVRVQAVGLRPGVRGAEGGPQSSHAVIYLRFKPAFRAAGK